MKIYRVSQITDEIVSGINRLIPQLSPNVLPATNQMLFDLVNSNNAILIVAQEEDIIGSLTLVFNKLISGKKLWIEDVVVDSKIRKKGVGKQLIEFAISYARQNGFSKIDLTSSPNRIAANKLYQKMGFIKRETNVYRIHLNL